MSAAPNQPSAGAMRAADLLGYKAISDEAQVNAAQIIDRESGAAELAEAIKLILSEVMFTEPKGLGSHYLLGVASGNCEGTRVAFAKARAALAKWEGKA